MIDKKLMSNCVKCFKEHGVITPAFIVRKFKTNFQIAIEICDKIKKRFPNLWREGREKFYEMPILPK